MKRDRENTHHPTRRRPKTIIMRILQTIVSGIPIVLGLSYQNPCHPLLQKLLLAILMRQHSVRQADPQQGSHERPMTAPHSAMGLA